MKNVLLNEFYKFYLFINESLIIHYFKKHLETFRNQKHYTADKQNKLKKQKNNIKSNVTVATAINATILKYEKDYRSKTHIITYNESKK